MTVFDGHSNCTVVWCVWPRVSLDISEGRDLRIYKSFPCGQALGGVPRHQELPPRHAGQAPGRAARGHRVGVGPRGLQARALLYRAQRQGGLRKQAALCWAGSGDRGRDARRAGAVDGRQRDAVRREETDSAAPEPPAAATDGSAAEGPNTEFGATEEWARLFTQPG